MHRHCQIVGSDLCQMSTAIPQGKHWFSSDHRSSSLSGKVSTWMGDRLGIPCVVNILAKSQFGFFYCIRLVFDFSETNYTFVNYQSVARICSFSMFSLLTTK